MAQAQEMAAKSLSKLTYPSTSKTDGNIKKSVDPSKEVFLLVSAEQYKQLKDGEYYFIFFITLCYK